MATQDPTIPFNHSDFSGFIHGTLDSLESLCKIIDTNLLTHNIFIFHCLRNKPELLNLPEGFDTKDLDAELLKQLRQEQQHLPDSTFYINKKFATLLEQKSKKHTSLPTFLKAVIAEIQESYPPFLPTSVSTLTTSSSDQDTTTDSSASASTDEQAPDDVAAVTETDLADQTKEPLVDERIVEPEEIEDSGQDQEEQSSCPQIKRAPYTEILTRDMLEKKVGNLVDREQETSFILWNILKRSTHNVLVTGQPGTGKTSLLGQVAFQALANPKRPLAAHTFFLLDVPKLLEGVVKQSITTKELIESLQIVTSQEHTVLLVDDFHYLITQGGIPLVNDFSACFKPFLKKNQGRFIFSCSHSAHEKHLAADEIFSQNTVRCHLDSPGQDELAKVVHHAAKILAAHHEVQVDDETIALALEKGNKPDGLIQPPGSCINLIDNACALAVSIGVSIILPEHLTNSIRMLNETALSEDRDKLRNLEFNLKNHIQGQNEAVQAVSDRIRLTKLQMDRKPYRPDGVFLFIGPSGVGKTELVKVLANYLFEDARRLVRIDMSEFMERHEYSKLIGAPPGYVGYGEEGTLTGPVSRQPESVVLFDEVEKAHPNILNLFLQLFDDGFITDGKGQKVDFSQTTVVMTSNIGKELWDEKKPTPGFLDNTEEIAPQDLQSARKYLLNLLPSEFVNRIDEVVPFQPLSKKALNDIAVNMLEEELQRWKNDGKNIIIDSTVLKNIIEKNYDPRLGARHIIRNLERMVGQPLSEAACKDDWCKVKKITIFISDKGTELNNE